MGPRAIEKIILLYRSSWNIGNIHILPLSFSWTSVSHCCPKRIKMWNQKLNYWIIFEVLILDLPVGNFAGKSSLCIWRSIFLKGCQQKWICIGIPAPFLMGNILIGGFLLCTSRYREQSVANQSWNVWAIYSLNQPEKSQLRQNLLFINQGN